MEHLFDGLGTEWQVRDHGFHSELKENLEKHLWVWLTLNQLFNVVHCFTCVDGLKEQQLSKSNFPNLDFENIFELGLLVHVFILLLKTHLSIFIELACEQEMVGLLNLQEITGA
jgi:hypothetical protein